MPDLKEFSLAEYEETIRFVTENDGEFRIYPKGTSMLPLIRQGADSVCLVKFDGELSSLKGKIIFYRRKDGHYVLHRVIGVSDNSLILCGDNQTQPEEGVTREMVIAVVNKVFRNDKLLDENCFGYRLYLFLWKSFSVRKIYFKLRGFKRRLNG